MSVKPKNDTTPVFMNIEGNNAWANGDKHKIDPIKLDNMTSYYQSGKYLNYILREEAALDVDIDPMQFNDLMTLKAQQTKLWEDYKLSQGIIDDNNLNLEQLAIRDKFDEPINAKIAELKANSPKFSGLHTYDPITKEINLVSDEDVQNEYDSLGKIKPEKQNVWTGVMSFSDEFTEKIKHLDPHQIDKELSLAIPRMLKKAGWTTPDINAAKIGWAYHINTDNFHAHFYIYQSKPTRFKSYIDKDGKENKWMEFVDKYAMGTKNIEDFRSQIDMNLSEPEMKEEYQSDVRHNRDWTKSFKGKIWAETKAMYQRIAKDWTPDNKQFIEVLRMMKEFQSSHRKELKEYKSLGSKNTPESWRQEIFQLEKNILKVIPHYQEEFDKFRELAKEHAEVKLERYMVYYKTPNKNGEMPPLDAFDLEIQAISPDDPKLQLKPSDYVAYKERLDKKNFLADEKYDKAKEDWLAKGKPLKEFDKSWTDFSPSEKEKKELYKDPYDWLKDKKIEFEYDDIYSRNEKGYPKGLAMDFGIELTRMMQGGDISIPHPKKEEISKSPRTSSSGYASKQLTNKRLSNSAYQLKKTMARIDQRMKKLELEMEKKFAQMQMDIEKAQMEEQKQWSE